MKDKTIRNNYPTTEEEAKALGVFILNPLHVCKIFEGSDPNILFNEANKFIIANGYEKLSHSEFINNNYSCESSDEIISLSPHGYIEAIVLFIKKENFTFEVEL